MTEMESIQFLNKKSVSESESSPTEVTSHAVLFVRPLPGAHAKKEGECHTRWHYLCLLNSTYGYFDGINPFIGKWHVLTVSYPDYGSWSIHVFRPKQRKKHTLWGGTYGLYKGVPSAGLYNSPTGTSTCVLINDFPCRRGKFDATSVLFIYLFFILFIFWQ